MSYVVLARKWRPMRFSDLVGQDHVARTLGNAIDSGRVAHAFLFTGVRGVGKTTSARILAKALNCMGDPETTPKGAPDPGPTVEPCLKCSACREIAEGRDVDVQEIDGASYNGVDEVRKLQDSLPYRPNRDRYKIVIVDEVHMLTQAAWNAFLKTLEEPPDHVKFIFATTEVHKVPITILSRVQRFDFKMIPARLIMDRLRWVLERENTEADEASLSILARQAAGSMRDAMSLLDQVMAFSGEKLQGDDVAQVLGVASRGALLQIAENLVVGEAEACLRQASSLADQGFDIPKVARDILALLRDLIVAKICTDASDLVDAPEEERGELVRIAGHASETDLMRLHTAFSRGFDDVVRGADPRAGLEMLLVRLAGRPELLPVDELLHRIAHLEKRLTGGASRTRAPRSPAGGAPMDTRARTRPRHRAPSTPRSASPAPARSEDDVPDAPFAGSDDPPHPADRLPEAALPAEGHLHPTTPSTEAAPSIEAAQSIETAQSIEAALPTESALSVETAPQRPDPARLEESEKSSRSVARTPPPPPSITTATRPPSPPPATSSSVPAPNGAAPAPNGAAMSPSPLPRPTQARPLYQPTEDEARALSRMAEVGAELQDEDVELAAYFDHLVPLVADGTTLRLGLERGHLFSSQLTAPAAQEKILAALHRAWGPDAELEFVQNCAEAITERTLSAQKARDRALRYQAAVEEVRNHPRVVEACRILGAQVKNVVLAE